jgi:medium-chain acyl-[acyl-carrier-protein] hydrolase
VDFPKDYTKTYQVRPNESDRFNELKVVGLIDLLQDMAWEHASRLQLSIKDLMDQGKTWVLSRYHIRYLKPAFQGEEVIIKTWPVGVHRLYALRDFSVRTAAGDTIALATSGWVILTYPN